MDYLSELNPEQRRAVTHGDGPMLIIAGAGSGKTKTLTYRILHLINSGANAGSILAITFTNKAAREMLERVGKLLGRRPPNYSGAHSDFPWIGTFHGLGAAILREFPHESGVHAGFTIIDEDDALSIIRKCLKRLGFDPKTVEPRSVRENISRAKSAGKDRQNYSEHAASNTARIASAVWRLYEDELRAAHAVDFDDLLLLAVNLLRTNESVRNTLHQRWSYVHVDEYQDTNDLQYSLVRLLIGQNQNICVVGDSDQTIYSWRGANIENILRFEEDFPGSQVITLEENYRSTQTILAAANTVIAKNVKRKPKNLFTTRGEGETITLYEAISEIEEAQYIAEHAKRLIRAGASPESIAILYRTNFQSRVLEEAFLGEDIPYAVAGTRFFERKEVRDILSYLRAAHHPENPLDLERAASTPSRGIGEKTLEQILSGKMNELKGKTKEKVEGFLKILAEIRDACRTLPTSQSVAFCLGASGILPMLKESDDIERVGNLSELVSLAQRYDTLSPEEGMARFLSDVALASDQDHSDRRSGVRLMTVHASKGLEFDTVFIAGLEEDLFPQCRMNAPDDREREEEERRLFYVALTRAKKKLILSHAAFRTVFGERRANVPSSFLADIDEKLVTIDLGANRSKRERVVFFD